MGISIYLFPPASSSRIPLCSQPYPWDMPSRTLHRSSSPQKIVAYALDFSRGKPAESLSLRGSPQTAVAIRTPPEAQEMRKRDLSNPSRRPSMYFFPSPAPRLACGKGRYVQACGPSAGKREHAIEHAVIARQSADCRGNPFPVGDAGNAE